MVKTRIQIIEDDPSYALELEMLLVELDFEPLPVISNPASYKPMDDLLPDLVIADIFFKGKPDGIQVVQDFQRKGIPVVLITSSENEELYEYAKARFPSGYLVKPVQKLSLKSVIDSALINREELETVSQALDSWTKDQLLKKYLFVRHSKSLVKLVVANISLIEADGNYCYIHEGGRRYVTKNSLRNFKESLSNQGFLQINRSQLVNFSMIDQVSFSNAKLILAGKALTIGSTYREEVLSWLHRL